MTLRRVLLVLAVLLAASGCGSSGSGSGSDGGSEAGSGTTTTVLRRSPVPGVGEIEVRIVEGPDGEPVVICVLVADTPAERSRGLMEVTDLGGYDGMLFQYQADSDASFWMRDTVLPLSVAYLDADGAVVSTADMEPCPDGTQCPSYPADGPFRMALEVAEGRLPELGLSAGSDAHIELAGPCTTPSG